MAQYFVKMNHSEKCTVGFHSISSGHLLVHMQNCSTAYSPEHGFDGEQVQNALQINSGIFSLTGLFTTTESALVLTALSVQP